MSPPMKNKNKLRHLQREASNQIRFKTIVWSSEFGDKKVIITNMLNGQMAKLDDRDMYAVEHVDHLWNLVLMVFCRDKNGNQYMKSLETRAPYHCNHADLIESLKHQHSKLSESVNSSDTIELAWVACTGHLSTNAAMKQLNKKPIDWQMIREA